MNNKMSDGVTTRYWSPEEIITYMNDPSDTNLVEYNKHTPHITPSSSSSFGQDLFAWKMSGLKSDGLFLDMGCAMPIETNNTYGLEKIGWTGWMCDLVDYGSRPEFSNVLRRASFFHGDGANFPIEKLPSIVDFLSFDVDGSWRKVADRLLKKIRFGVITLEHDLYAGGYAEDKNAREGQREMLLDLGYDLVCSDVRWDEGPIEDWWVDPAYCDKSLRDEFRCHDQHYKMIVSKIKL